MTIVAFSNAQAKNISVETVKAKTLHNVCVMRVQKYVNAKLRPGATQKRAKSLCNALDLHATDAVTRTTRR
eukprot:5405065-Pyramimonas_sp.AAC.1